MLQPPAGSRLPPKKTGTHDDQIFDDSYLEDLKLLEKNNQDEDITAEQFVEEQTGLERTYSRDDLQQSCSQELAKELDLINGGFYDFQEKAFRIIGQHLIAIVGDSTTTEEEKQKKITELYEHDELYWILGQYGLKHVALIKLIEKLKHHSYGLTHEQIKLLEKYGMPEHVKNVKLFLESQLKKMPPTTRQQKQDLIYKVIEVASIYNMSLPEEQWITGPEIDALVDSMSDLLYNIATVEEDRKQMLRSPNPLRRDKAIEHFSTHYISNMIQNDNVMTYSARLDHFLEMMLILKSELDTVPARDKITPIQVGIRNNNTLPPLLYAFKHIYNSVNYHYALHTNERVFIPKIESLFFEVCLAERYEIYAHQTHEVRETFGSTPVGKYLRETGVPLNKNKDELLKYFLSEVAPADQVEKNFAILKKVYAGNISTREQIREMQEAIQADESFDDHIKLLEVLYQYFGQVTGSIVRKAGSAKEIDAFLVATATSDRFAKATSYYGKNTSEFEEIGNAIKVAGGTQVGMFLCNVGAGFWDKVAPEARGEKIGRFIIAAGGGKMAAHILIGKIKPWIKDYVDEVYDVAEEKRIKELGEEGTELARQEFFRKVSTLKAELISLQVGQRYADGFLDALKLCGSIEKSEIRRRIEMKLLKEVTYIQVKGKPCIVFPKNVMPHPWSLEDATPEEVYKDLIALSLEKNGNYWEGRPHIMNSTDFRKRYYYNSSVVRHTEMIPSNEMYRNLLQWLDETSGSGMFEAPFAKAPRSDILASLCNLGFPGIENKSVFNGPKLGDVNHTCCVRSNSGEYLLLSHNGTARIQKYEADTYGNTLRLFILDDDLSEHKRSRMRLTAY